MTGSTRPALLIAVAVDSLGTGLFAPLSLLYFVHLADLPLTTVGLLVSIGTLVSLPVPFVAGALADRFGAKPVVIAGQTVQALGFMGYLVARESIPVLLSVAIVAVGQRLFWSTFFTMVAESVDGDADARAADRRFARVGMAQAGGLGLGALIAGVAIAAAADHVYFAIAIGNVISFAVSGALLLRVRTRRRAPSDAPRALGGYRALLCDGPYLGYTLANIPFAICSVMLGIAVPVFVVSGLDAPDWTVGPLLALNTVLLTIGQLAATRLTDRMARTHALAIAGGLWAAWALLTALALRLPGEIVPVYLFGTVLLFAAAEVIHAPLSNALATAAAPDRHRGSYLAVFQYGFTVASLVVPAGFAWLFSTDPALPWLVIAALALVSSAAMLFLTGRLRAQAT